MSYWRRGRSRPERPESLNAVAALEEILKLAPGELTGKLGDKRPRGRWVERAAALEGIWQEAAIDLGRAIARVDRILVARMADDTDNSPGAIFAEKSCRIGRVRTDDENKLLVAEIIFDRVLRAGDTALVDLRFTADPGAPSSSADRRSVRAMRDYVLEVEFHPDAVPVRCHGFTRAEEGAPDVNTGELWIGTTATTHLVVRDAQPGVHGIKWEWE